MVTTRNEMCGQHVEKVALVLTMVLMGIIVTQGTIVLVDLVLKAADNRWNLFFSPLKIETLLFISFAFFFLKIGALLFIFFAQRYRKPGLYIPFLVFQAFDILGSVLSFVNVIVEIVKSIALDCNVLDETTNHEMMIDDEKITNHENILRCHTRQDGGEHLVSLLAPVWDILYTILVVIHYISVVRAYRYMHEENHKKRGGAGAGRVATPTQQQIPPASPPQTGAGGFCQGQEFREFKIQRASPS